MKRLKNKLKKMKKKEDYNQLKKRLKMSKKEKIWKKN